MCAGRESNSGLVRGRDVYYHCTTGADILCLDGSQILKLSQSVINTHVVVRKKIQT